MTSSHELQPGASQNPGAFSLDFLTWAFVHVGLEGLLTFQLVATAGLWFLFLLPWHPLSLHSPPPTHRAQKCPHPGCQGLTEQSTKFKKYGSLASFIEIHCDDLFETTLLTLHGGSHGSEERKGPKQATPHTKGLQSQPPAQSSLILEQSVSPPVSLPRLFSVPSVTQYFRPI